MIDKNFTKKLNHMEKTKKEKCYYSPPQFSSKSQDTNKNNKESFKIPHQTKKRKEAINFSRQFVLQSYGRIKIKGCEDIFMDDV